MKDLILKLLNEFKQDDQGNPIDPWQKYRWHVIQFPDFVELVAGRQKIGEHSVSYHQKDLAQKDASSFAKGDGQVYHVFEGDEDNQHTWRLRHSHYPDGTFSTV